MGEIIVFDGRPGSGKTTIGNLLKRNSNIHFIQEKADIRFPVDVLYNNAKKGDNKAQREIDRWFLEFDLRRENEALAYAKKGQIVILERNHVSTLAYSYSLSKLRNNDCFDSLLKFYLEHKSLFQSPSFFLILKIDESVSQSRQYNRKAISGYPWDEEKFIKLYHIYYEDFIRQNHPNSYIRFIDTDRKINKVMTEIRVLIKGLNDD